MTTPAYQINPTEDDLNEGVRAAEDYQEGVPVEIITILDDGEQAKQEVVNLQQQDFQQQARELLQLPVNEELKNNDVEGVH